MARQLRLEFAGAMYHVTARGNDRQAIYADDQDRARFLDLLAREIDQQRWHCYAYCLMDNHYHMLLETPGPTLSQGMRRLNGVYTQTVNRRHGRVGHVLQGRFKSIVVDKESYLLELCRYIALNPVRAHLVRTPEQWAWSSYLATAGMRRAPDWLAVGEVLGLFDRERRAAQRAYRQFVREGIGQPSPWAKLRGQIFLGSEAFLARMERLVRGQHVANVPVAQTQPGRLNPEEVLSRVGAVYGVGMKELAARTHAEAYQCAAWLLRRAANEPLKAVAWRFGVSPSRISHIQRALNGRAPSRQQRQAMVECKVKQ